MKRTAFRSKLPERRPARQWEGGAITARAPARVVPSLRLVEPIAKENALQHLGYMAAVRKIACRRCGTVAVRRVFCHADEGKGGAIKTDCRRGWAGCDACHHYVGSTGKLGKAGRRAFEETAAASTRAEIINRGLWPARLPRWTDE